MIRHAFALIRADKLFSGIYVAGTAVAIASAMVIAIVLNVKLADIPPESNRSRTLYLSSRFIPGEKSEYIAYHQGHSSVALDSCYRRMACVEAATGIIPAMQNRFTIVGEQQGLQEPASVSAIATDPDFFRLYDLDFISGRPFSEKEFRSGERVCVITDKLAEKTGGGETVLLNDLPFRVVGVVKAVSAFMEDATADAYVPYMAEGIGLHPNNRNPLRNGDVYVDVAYAGNLQTRILLREGYTRKDFLAELEPLRRRYSAVISSQAGEQVEWEVMARTHFFHKINFFHSSYGGQGLADEAKNLMPPAVLMLLFLLLPAINLSGLVSNRMEARRAEMGIRKAFGARRRWLLNEVVGENLVLTLLGGMAGWLLSALFIAAISDNQTFLQMFVSRDQNVVSTSLDLRMFFTPTLFLVVLLCCVLLNLMAALLPAWHSLRQPIVESLNQKR